MIHLHIFKYKITRKNNQVLNCISMFLVIFTPLLFICGILQHYSNIVFHIALLFTGWVSWTFFEYMAHRYLMHSNKKEKQLIDFNHAYHHSHPTEIKITGFQRFLLFAGFVFLIFLSIWLDNYFTLAAGFLCGFPIYTLMHFFLHQKSLQKILSRLVKYHIYHHCKYPDKCFGISVTWWDDLLGTIPSKRAIISERIIDFYFNHDKYSAQ